ncbi:DNA damage-inducible protein 1-like protein [Tanacetum coccineum]
MTRSRNTKVFTPFANPERQFQNKKDVTPITVHNIYSFYESESSESESEDLNEIDIETLTLEQYLALNRNNTQVRVKRPEIGENVAFEIKNQLLRELRDNTFSRNKTEDAMEHLQKVLEIASLFNIPGILGNDMMLRISPLTLTGAAKRWLGRTSSDILKTWDELKQVFIRRFCPPFILDSRGLILGLTTIEALESIQEREYHSPIWHNEESDRKTSNNSLSTITDKLKNLNRNMNDLRENIHKINQKSNKEFRHEEVKSMRARETKQDNQRFTKPLSNLKETFKQCLEESHKRQNILDKWMQDFIENTNKNLQRHELTIKKLLKKVVHLAHALADRKVKHNTSVMDGVPNVSTSVQQECVMKLEPPHETPTNKMETFTEKVKKRIMETQANEEKLLKKLESELVNITLVKDIRKTPEYTWHLQYNALADLGASISVMPFSMFKRLGIGNLRPVNMVIEMADRSMQSPKGIVENVLVKIHKFIFPVDFVILDIVEDDKVPIILGRPMLATTHARIDVFGGKILLEVGKEQIIFNANEGATPVTISPACVIKFFDVIDNFRGPKDLEELLMYDDINGDLGNFLKDNNMLPDYEDPGARRLCPSFPRINRSLWLASGTQVGCDTVLAKIVERQEKPCIGRQYGRSKTEGEQAMEERGVVREGRRRYEKRAVRTSQLKKGEEESRKRKGGFGSRKRGFGNIGRKSKQGKRFSAYEKRSWGSVYGHEEGAINYSICFEWFWLWSWTGCKWRVWSVNHSKGGRVSTKWVLGKLKERMSKRVAEEDRMRYWNRRLMAIDDLCDDLDPGSLTNEQPLKPKFLSIRNRVNRYNPYNLQITCKIGFVNFNPYIDPISPFNVMSRAAYNSVIKRELIYAGNNNVGKANTLHVFIECHTFLTDFIILENVNEFVEKGLTVVIFGKPFKEKIGLEEDISKGILWFKIGKDKTIFNMPRAERRLSKLTTEQQNMMSPILKVSDENKAKGISHPYQKIKELYKGCLNLGEEYKQDLEVIGWIKREHASMHELT